MKRAGESRFDPACARVLRSPVVVALAVAAALLAVRAPLAKEPAAVTPMAAGVASSAAKKAAPPAAPALVDINSASRKTLKTLPGIGDVEAGRIIAGRPYLSKADLVTGKVLEPSVYAGLRSAIVARQKGVMPTGAKGSKGTP
jgi:competence protein ComEA